ATGLSSGSPAAFFSSLLILSSASSSFAWQALTSRLPSSNLANNDSNGSSPDSIVSTMDSSFFSASSNANSLAAPVGLVLFAAFGTRGTLSQRGGRVYLLSRRRRFH